MTKNGIQQVSVNGRHYDDWWDRQKQPWQLYPSPLEPTKRLVRNKAGSEVVEFVWWLDPCPEAEDFMDECPGFLIEHTGPRGDTTHKRECPVHGYRWKDRGSARTDSEKQKDIDLRMSAALIPPQQIGYSFSTYVHKDSEAYSICREYARAGKLTASMLLIGGYGTGKTFLAISILKYRIENYNERGLFMVVPSLFEEIKSLFGKEGESSALLQRVTNVPLLVLDDLGAERATEWVQENLYHILNTRQANGRPTIITTNLDYVGLVKQLGQRTVERIKTYQNVIEVDGENMRDVV